MQFFGDKYGDTVRVVQIGGRPGGLDGYSMELCAGTHVRATGQLGAFKIVSEGAISAPGCGGSRPSSGQAALGYFREHAAAQARRVEELEAKLAELNKAQEKDKANLPSNATRRRSWTRRCRRWTPPRTCRASSKTSRSARAGAELLPTILNGLKGRKFKGVAVLVGVAEGTVHMAVGVSPEFVGRFNAGKIVQQLASIVSGKGGGKADQARGAGKDAGKVDAVLKKAGTMLG